MSTDKLEIPADAGLEGIEGTGNVIIPRRALVQPTSQQRKWGLTKPVQAGHFVDKFAKVSWETMDAVILRSRRSRRLMPPYNQDPEKNKPRCWSNDGIVPAENVKHPLSPTGQCKDCEFNKQDEQLTLLCLDVKQTQENGFPVVFQLTAQKSSLGITASFLRSFGAQRKRPADYVVTISSEPGKNESGNYLVLKYTTTGPVPEDLKENVAIAYHMYSDSIASAPADHAEDDKEEKEEVPF